MLKKKKFKEDLIGYSFIIPSLIGFFVFMVYPIIYSFIMSFMKWSMFGGFKDSHFVGMANYQAVFHNEYFLAGLRNNIVFSLVAVPLLLITSLVVACLLNQEIHGRGMLRVIYFMPYIATVTAAAVVFSVLFHPTLGPINGVLRHIGISNPPQWLASSKWALFTIELFWVWKGLGYCVVIYLAGLQSIPPSLYEASSIDGASAFQQFRNITLPLVTPTTFFLAITNIIGSFQIFPQIKIMTEGGPGTSTMTMIYHLYQMGFEQFKMGYASAVSWVFFGVVMIITGVQWWGQKKWVKYI